MQATQQPTDAVRQFISRYCEGKENLLRILRAMPEPRGQLLTTLLHLREVRVRSYSAERALEEAAALPLTELADPDVAAIFFMTWSTVCLQLGRLEEAEALMHQAEAAISPQTAPEVAATFFEDRGLLEGTKGNKAAREKFLTKALAVLPPASGRRRFLLFNRALFLAEQGRAAEVAEDLALLEGSGDESLRPGHIAAVRFVDAVEAGRLDEAAKAGAAYQQDAFVVRMVSAAAVRRVALELMTSRWEDRPDEKGTDILWARSTQMLIDHRSEDALRWARAHAEADPQAHLYMGFQSLALIRAELANGNAVAAMRLLGQRWTSGYRNYLDDFFVGRAALVNGNRKMAAWYMATAVEAAERHRAFGRLDFEARLALEMSPAEVVKLLPLGGHKAAAPKLEPEVKAPTHGTGRLLGKSAAIAAVRQAVERFAPLNVPVLITGETGTGKELVARAIHECGAHPKQPFSAVNCAAISDSLLESELFGHERGAFTGAASAHRGLFEEAGAGTLLLDEIGEISPRLQVVLLRVLETSEVRPVGSARTRRVSCRVIAATNADLAGLAAQRRFREDLMFRLRRLEIRIPALRERREDIPILATQFLCEGRSPGEQVTMSADLMAELRRRDWPGNVRELRNCIERMRLLNSDKTSYDLSDLDPELAPRRAAPRAARPPSRASAPAATLGAAASPPAGGSVEDVLLHSRNPMRRLDRLRDLFRQHSKLTRREICLILKVSHNTASTDLGRLCDEGFIEKIKPSPSPRSHYFVLRDTSGDR